jgi:hypothetical protein
VRQADATKKARANDRSGDLDEWPLEDDCPNVFEFEEILHGGEKPKRRSENTENPEPVEP